MAERKLLDGKFRKYSVKWVSDFIFLLLMDSSLWKEKMEKAMGKYRRVSHGGQWHFDAL